MKRAVATRGEVDCRARPDGWSGVRRGAEERAPGRRFAGNRVAAGTTPWFERITASAFTGALHVPPSVHWSLDGDSGTAGACDAWSAGAGSAAACW